MTKLKFKKKSSKKNNDTGLVSNDNNSCLKPVETKINNEIRNDLEDLFFKECREIGNDIQISQKAKKEGFIEISDEFEKNILKKIQNLTVFIKLLDENTNNTTQENLESIIFEKYNETKAKLKLSKKLKMLKYDSASKYLEKMYKEENSSIKIFSKLFFKYFKNNKKI